MDFLSNYALFLVKFTTSIVLILFGLIAILAIATKNKKTQTGKISITNINDKYDDVALTLQQELLSSKKFKAKMKQVQKAQKEEQKKGAIKNKIFVISFDGDIKASQVTQLREVITAILMVATPEDEVLIKLESPGGLVHAYGLAASQLARIREKGIPLTVTVDKVAASGGYMMACVANKIVAAPFAIIGSIGVLIQLPNFHRLLKHHHIDFEQLSAGEFKRTLTVFGENTSKGRKKMQEEIEVTHDIFKDFIKRNRPILDVDHIATGEYWLAQKAYELRLVDHISTSDDYLLEAKDKHNIFEVTYEQKKSLAEKISRGSSKIIDSVIARLAKPEHY